MAITTQSLLDAVLLQVEETQGSPITALPADDGSDAITAEAGLLLLLNESRAFLWTRCFADSGVFVAPDSVVTAGKYAIPLSAFAANPAGEAMKAATGSALWWPRGIHWKPTTGTGAGTYAALIAVSEDLLAVQYRDYQTASGTLSHWYRAGNRAVGVRKVPAVAGALRAEGLLVPPAIANGDGVTVAWLQETEQRLLIVETALRVIRKAFADAEKAPRFPLLQAERNDLALAAYLSLPEGLRGPGKAFPLPPVAVGK